MVVRHVMATLSLLLTVHTFISAAEVINKNIVRTVDASKAIVKVVLAIEAAGVDGEYQLSFSDTEASHLAHLTAVVGGKKQERAQSFREHTMLADVFHRGSDVVRSRP